MAGAGGAVKDGVKAVLKRKLRKIRIWLYGIIAGLLLLGGLAMGIYNGISSAVSWLADTLSGFWETSDTSAVAGEVAKGDGVITDQMLQDGMIDRETMYLLLEEIADYNNGAYFGDYAEQNITVEGDDSYSYFDYYSYTDEGWFPCDANDYGAEGYVWGGPRGWSSVSSSQTYSIVDGKYVEDDEGEYVCTDDGRHVSADSVSWERLEEYEVETNQCVSVDNATKCMDFSINNKWMYQEFPMDWEPVYMFAVYRFLDEHDGIYIMSGNDTSANAVARTLTDEEAYELVEAFRPWFNFATLPSAKDPDGNRSNVFEALIKYNGAWNEYLSWKATWKKGNVFRYSASHYYTNSDIKSMYGNNNPWGERLLAGEPQKVVWYWTDWATQQYDDNGQKVKDPVVHKTILYVPVSVLESVQTVVARYSYTDGAGAAPLDEGSLNESAIWADATEIDLRKYSITWAAVSSDSDLQNKTTKTSSGALSSRLTNQITGRDVIPYESVFDSSRFKENLRTFAGDRDWRAVVEVIRLLPQGKNVASVLEAACQYDGLDIETSKQSYNNGRNTSFAGGVEYGEGGLRTRGVAYSSDATVRSVYGDGERTRAKNTPQGKFIGN